MDRKPFSIQSDIERLENRYTDIKLDRQINRQNRLTQPNYGWIRVREIDG